MKYLLTLITQALEILPPQAILDYCEPFYSPYYHLMYLLAKESAYALCVECGVESGRGSFSMLYGGARVIGIDNNPDRKDVLKENGNFQMIIGTSTDVPQAVKEAGRQISVLHIDTEHNFTQAKNEFEAYKPFLKDGAVVLFDDTNAMNGEVLRYLESLPYEKFVNDDLHPSCGFGGMIYKEDL